MKTVAIVSGGMDSSTLAYQLKGAGDELYILTFNYGQRHAKEIEYAMRLADRLDVPWQEVDVSSLGKSLNSALTTEETDVPEGHYAAENMAATVVPNRNAIMLSIATGVAVALRAERVAFAAHSGDHPIYPDCRPAFVEAMTDLIRLANEGYCEPNLYIFAPYLGISKADIVKLGDAVGVPYGETWSCYKGGKVHCGRCGTCVERKEAFRLAGVSDPTEYEDVAYEIEAYRG